ncbi:benzodiazepine receptor [Novimethylophilus kurashikiensis]|uniref:Benzodiazepine receptor n=1 Tax=Novimethylophilus kurashikiensis TaxID=1825523 RepID=A0A2R5F8X1_9PROT|nr:TspO/MBR family protein [Novimethylophilus kurashikiensis]GBG13074.1 benzodiazepine receptor [Novimethylophilus kurashikiensis]
MSRNDISTTATSKSLSLLLLVLAVALVAATAATGIHFQPGDWYEALQKPAWTPPNSVFPPVWSLLYLMIAIVGWRVFRSRDSTAICLWLAQLMANGLWSWLFFGLHQLPWALTDILIIAGLVGALVQHCWNVDRWVSFLLLPYLLWVLYAASLNGAILLLN